MESILKNMLLDKEKQKIQVVRRNPHCSSVMDDKERGNENRLDYSITKDKTYTESSPGRDNSFNQCPLQPLSSSKKSPLRGNENENNSPLTPIQGSS